MDFRGLDLNLLVAFDALMEEQNVTRAAIRASVSQPAMSAALSRLRTHFADPLFIRSAAGLVPTARAKEIAIHVTKALQELTHLLTPDDDFAPHEKKSPLRWGCLSTRRWCCCRASCALSASTRLG
jgi:DNA-binding transcriptional LysR family regulator